MFTSSLTSYNSQDQILCIYTFIQLNTMHMYINLSSGPQSNHDRSSPTEVPCTVWSYNWNSNYIICSTVVDCHHYDCRNISSVLRAGCRIFIKGAATSHTHNHAHIWVWLRFFRPLGRGMQNCAKLWQWINEQKIRGALANVHDIQSGSLEWAWG